MVFSSDAAPPVRTGPRDPALRKSRICYDHLAGEMGVKLFERMQEDQWLADDLTATDQGRDKLSQIGINLEDLPSATVHSAVAASDWSQRHQRLAGRMGKAILDRLLILSWARRLPDSRIISFSPEGERRFNAWLG